MAAEEGDAGQRRRGGRVAGKSYTPGPPHTLGTGTTRFPYRDCSSVAPQHLQDALVMWQDICLDIREERIARGQEQKDVAAGIGVSPNTIQNLENGEWVHPSVMFRTAAWLGLEIWQAVEVRRNSPPPRRRRG